MKAVYLHAAGAIAVTFGLAACVQQAAQPAPTPPPVVTPAPTPAPPPPPPPPPVVQEPRYDNYLDAPQTEGTWRYSTNSDGSAAEFAVGDQTPTFAILCNSASNTIEIERIHASHIARDLTARIVTETTGRDLQAVHIRPGKMTIRLPASDPLLDAMAITKGRIAVEMEGYRTLYIPAWVEISRVIEDCR